MTPTEIKALIDARLNKTYSSANNSADTNTDEILILKALADGGVGPTGPVGPAGPAGLDGLAVPILRQVDIQLSDAQIKDLIATPVQVLPAPGVGKCYLFPTFSCAWQVLDTTGGAYTVADEQLGLPNIGFFFGSSGRIDPVMENGGWQGPANNGVGGILRNLNDSCLQGDSTYEFSSLGNVPVLIKNIGDQDWIGGHANNTLSMRIYYTIADGIPFGA